MIEKEFIPYYLAIDLKELGFDDEVIATYPKNRVEIKLNNVKVTQTTKAILFQQAFRWFREKYGLNSHIHQENRNNYSYCCGQGYSDEIDGYQDFDTYEEAELACLKKLIKIVKGGNK
jgi:hypothetical protein